MDLDRESTIAGHRVRWTARGSGPPVVFCHGTPWSSRLWAPVAAALEPAHRVFLWDMPGYGESGRSADVSLGVQGRLLAELLAEWGVERPHVVAHDYGGAVSLRAHLLHGAGYASLTLVDVVALAPWGSDFFRLVSENSEVFGALPGPLHEALVRAYVRGAAHRPLRAADEGGGGGAGRGAGGAGGGGASGRGAAPRPLRAADEDVLVGPWLGTEGAAAFYRQIAQADQRFTDEIEPRYGELDLPVTVIWGTEDTWIPVDRAHRLTAAIPGAELHLVPGAGHLIQLDAPEMLTALVSRAVSPAPCA